MPEIAGDPNDFKLKWNQGIRDRYYGPKRKANLDGEYIDSSEGYVTAQLDFRREHFSAATTPLCFSPNDHRPAIFRGLIAFEYIRRISRDVHGMNRLMMANSTPIRLCWLAPSLDVMGTETDWNRNGQWRPMSSSELLYRRAICKGKPFCFLMNTRFEQFTHELAEKYMKRALAFGMFPGFFSHNASQGHYFTRPELYNRDRKLFTKYIPLCRKLAEAGWEPIPHARCANSAIRVERFGKRYLTVFNDSASRQSIRLNIQAPLLGDTCRELISQSTVACANGILNLTLDAEDVRVLEFR